MKNNKVLIVYTGGTIGMVQDENGSLHPFALDRIYDAVPQLKSCQYGIDSVTLDNIIDSSNMTPSLWVDIANIIERDYDATTASWCSTAPTPWPTPPRR